MTKANNSPGTVSKIDYEYVPEHALSQILAYMRKRDRDRIYAAIKYLVPEYVWGESHIVAKAGDRIVGIAGLKQNPYQSDHLWVMFVSVDPKFQGCGIARRLIEDVYEHARANGLKVEPSSFTPEGRRLRHIFDDLDTKYPEAACGMTRQTLGAPDEEAGVSERKP
jgi:GNAT superfamily N-acetyltransferase